MRLGEAFPASPRTIVGCRSLAWPKNAQTGQGLPAMPVAAVITALARPFRPIAP